MEYTDSIQMGLGKTIQSIALIITHPHPKFAISESAQIDEGIRRVDEIERTTLIVAPLGLIKQWEGELNNRTTTLKRKLKVYVHHGPSRHKESRQLAKYDVVITTYPIVASEHKSTTEARPSSLFGLRFWRIILDEAHTIKNPSAKGSQACFALRARHRWCLTGTPIQNNLTELQSLVRFLRIEPYDDMPYWKEYIAIPMKSGKEDQALERLRKLLSTILLRRTKKILGEKEKADAAKGIKQKPGTLTMNLPERTVKNIVCEFTHGERAFYEKLEEKTSKKIDEMAQDTKLNYTGALVLLLRLRQACNHPQLLAGKVTDDAEALAAVKPAATKKKATERDVDDLADLLGGLDVKARTCDICLSDLSKKEVSAGAVRCVDCKNNLRQFKDVRRRESMHVIEEKRKETPEEREKRKAQKRAEKEKRREERRAARKERRRKERQEMEDFIVSDEEVTEGGEADFAEDSSLSPVVHKKIPKSQRYSTGSPSPAPRRAVYRESLDITDDSFLNELSGPSKHQLKEDGRRETFDVDDDSFIHELNAAAARDQKKLRRRDIDDESLQIIEDDSDEEPVRKSRAPKKTLVPRRNVLLDPEDETDDDADRSFSARNPPLSPKKRFGVAVDPDDESDSDKSIVIGYSKPAKVGGKYAPITLDSDDEDSFATAPRMSQPPILPPPSSSKSAQPLSESDDDSEEDYHSSEDDSQDDGNRDGLFDSQAEESDGPESDGHFEHSALSSGSEASETDSDTDSESSSSSESDIFNQSIASIKSQSAVGDASFLSRDDEGSDSIFPSTKITHLMRILHKELKAGNKTIVFSQFTSMLDLIEPFFRQASIEFARYDGSMKNDDREASLRQLKDPKSGCDVLLCSLKCGAVGLNLTAACRVVILEPFWNPAIEEQAIDRVHRFGQTRPVVVYKLSIKDSVEERVLALQEEKRRLIEAAIGSGSSMSAANKLGFEGIVKLVKKNVLRSPVKRRLGMGREIDEFRTGYGSD